jgi:hypothetical protein
LFQTDIEKSLGMPNGAEALSMLKSRLENLGVGLWMR